jgi:RecQ family ATP-dependent DNA helicase
MNLHKLPVILKTVFGFNSFREHQLEVCEQVTLGRDVLLVMPTGAGKSLCYQIPGLARGGTALVISPLIALIEDQVSKLKAKGLRAKAIHSGQMRNEQWQICQEYREGKLQFLFLAPERLGVPGFMEMLELKPPTLITIDEAHCISQWGHDFRPDYRALGEHCQKLSGAPILALTATATPMVQNDICSQLKLKDEMRSVYGFRRTNIAIDVMDVTPSQRPSIIETIIKDQNKIPAIIYTPTRKMCESLYDTLKEKFSKNNPDKFVTLNLGIYHAGLKPDVRENNQQKFIQGKIDVMVATIAFGMGIDKADIRTVIHASLPSSVENYYQEIGRAGRDGLPSRAILLYSYGDHYTHQFFFEKDYPPVMILRKIYQKLTEINLESISKIDLLELMMPMNAELFDKALEKLWTHQAVKIDYAENVMLGEIDKNHQWERSYLLQRDHKEKQLKLINDYCKSHQCRMLTLVKHFGDELHSQNQCGNCDFCRPLKSENQAEFNYRKKVGLTTKDFTMIENLFTILKGTKNLAQGRLFQELSEHQSLERNTFENIMQLLVKNKIVTIKQESFFKGEMEIHYNKVSLGPRASSEFEELKKSQPELLESEKVETKKPKTKLRKKPEPKIAREIPVGPNFESLAQKVKVWRLNKARDKKIPAFTIFSDKTLHELCLHQPQNEESLLMIKGIGPKLVEYYGKELLQLMGN